jgi:hypothetical protein
MDEWPNLQAPEIGLDRLNKDERETDLVNSFISMKSKLYKGWEIKDEERMGKTVDAIFRGGAGEPRYSRVLLPLHRWTNQF